MGRPLQQLLVAVYASCSFTVTQSAAAAATAASALSFSFCMLFHKSVWWPVTRCRADRVLLRERRGGRGHVPSLAAHARGGPRARVAAVRLVLRADDVRQLRRRGGVGGYDDESRESLQSKQGYNKPC